jgi:putative ABC transport system permease protein
MRDLRYGVRVLRKNPGFTLIAVATLALGIGANSAMFSVVNTVLLKPFSFRNPEQLFVVARLKDGVTLARAEADLRNITERLATEYPETNSGWDAHPVPIHEQVIGDVRTALWALPIAVGFVLLIACVNVANLLLVRATRRQREMAIRASLGAGRFTLIRQMLAENILLSLMGGALGLILAIWILKLTAVLAPPNIYRLNAVSIDSRVVVFTLLVSFVTSLFFGSIPALQVSRINLVTALKASGASVSGRNANGSVLVITEVALALVLLTGAGLLVNSFIRLQNVPTGLQPEQLVAMSINLPRATYGDAQARLTFIDRLMPRLTALPGLKFVAFGSNLPLDVGLQGTSFKVEGAPVVSTNTPHTHVSIVSPAYFQTLGISILQGRDFAGSDTRNSPGVVIINEMGFRDGVPLEVIGVTADVRQTGLQADPYPGMFLPYSQYQASVPLVFVIRSANDPGAVAAAVRNELRHVDSQVPIYDVKTMDQVLQTVTARPRFLTFLLVLFAGVAVLLAAIGIYGIMSYTVAQGRREIGIRAALGAQRRDLLRMVLRKGLKLTLIGIALGLIGAFGLTRLMSNLLFGVSATDPMTFAGVTLLLVIVALVASYLPARRATKIDPLVALRYE